MIICCGTHLNSRETKVVIDFSVNLARLFYTVLDFARLAESLAIAKRRNLLTYASQSKVLMASCARKRTEKGRREIRCSDFLTRT